MFKLNLKLRGFNCLSIDYSTRRLIDECQVQVIDAFVLDQELKVIRSISTHYEMFNTHIIEFTYYVKCNKSDFFPGYFSVIPEMSAK